MLSPREAVQLILVIHRHCGDFLESPIAGQLAEPFDHFITIRTASEYDTHKTSLWFAVQSRASRGSRLNLDSRHETRNYFSDSCSYTCHRASTQPLMLTPPV